MPVLPEVGSIRASPGWTRPSRSAASSIQRAGRSFTEPVGLCHSSLARSSIPVAASAPQGHQRSGPGAAGGSAQPGHPPATAGRITRVEPSATGVSRPCR